MSTPLDELMEAVEWIPTGLQGDGSGLPYATHTGVLRIGEIALGCFQLSDGRRVIDSSDLHEVFGRASEMLGGSS